MAGLHSRCQFQRTETGAGAREPAIKRVPILLFNVLISLQKALESFYALGQQSSGRIMAKYSIHKLAKVGSLPPKTITSLTAELSQMTLDSDAKKIMQDNIRRLKDIGSYRGRRHAMSMPVRGQRTRTQTSTANKLNRVDRRA